MKGKSESEAAQLCPTLRNAKEGPQPARLLRPWDFPSKSTGLVAMAFSDLCIELKTIHNKKFSLSFGLWYCAWIWLLNFL